uniref:Uncharacterized protein n=1 Tax=Pinguiococcus pyrenoidosus TaxID=172671 RepID=A0A7R9UAM7_9STRA|mmetsp:Transcript_3545/g.13973  ORF Transcript_3545/g.13973 Transcript_3545/m.13973 type:complete len:212 (+) Transcript_3545:74-709(+)
MTGSEKEASHDEKTLQSLKEQFSALKADTLQLCDRLDSLREEEARLQAGNELLAQELVTIGISACQAQVANSIATHKAKVPAPADATTPRIAQGVKKEAETPKDSAGKIATTGKRSAPAPAVAPAVKRPAPSSAQNLVRPTNQLLMMKGNMPQMMASVNQAIAANPMLQMLATNPGLNLGATLNMAMNPVLNPNLHRGFLPRPPPNNNQKR